MKNVLASWLVVLSILAKWATFFSTIFALFSGTVVAALFYGASSVVFGYAANAFCGKQEVTAP